MKNKKSIAIAMSALSIAGAVAPAFAAEKAVEVKIDVELAEKGRTGATQEQISDAIQALEAAKKELRAFSEATYTVEDKNGEDIVQNRYTITLNKTASTKNEDGTSKYDGRVEVTVENDLVNETDNVKTRRYVFYNVDGVVDRLPSFGNPDEEKTIFKTISYNESTFNSTIAKIKEAIKAEELKYEVRLLQTDLNGTIGKYELTLKYDALENSEEVNEGKGLKDIAVITITDAPIGLGGVNGDVLIPEKNDFTGHWAQTEIKNAMLDKWINASSTFRPEDSITRAEFVKIINRAFNIPTNDVTPRMAQYFEDVDSTAWYYNDVLTAVKYGYISGYETTTNTTNEAGENVTTKVKEFKPNQPITRQEAAKIIATVINKVNLDENGKDLITSFADDKDIAVWADQSVQFLKDNEISNGYKENGKVVFKPLNKITRAEAVVMMGRAIDVKVK